MQEEACCATFNLASDEKNCALLGESGACEKVVKALQSFPSEMQVRHLCWVLVYYLFALRY